MVSFTCDIRATLLGVFYSARKRNEENGKFMSKVGRIYSAFRYGIKLKAMRAVQLNVFATFEAAALSVQERFILSSECGLQQRLSNKSNQEATNLVGKSSFVTDVNEGLPSEVAKTLLSNSFATSINKLVHAMDWGSAGLIDETHFKAVRKKQEIFPRRAPHKTGHVHGDEQVRMVFLLTKYRSM